MSRVLQLVAENVKRIEVLDITPEGDIVNLAGKNKMGKTSAIQCLSAAIEGARHIQKVPIREGAEEGQITLTLGTKGKDGQPDTVEMIVHREFSRREASKSDTSLYATKLTLTLGDGQQPRKAQEILNGLYNSICTDPLAFTRMKPNEQFNALRAMVPGFKFEEHDNLQRADKATRTDYNRDADKAKASASLISVPTGTPDTLVDELAITNAMAEAGTKNGEIETRKANRIAATERLVIHRSSIASARTNAVTVKTACEDECAAVIAEANARCDRMRAAALATSEANLTQAFEEEAVADALQKKIDGAEELPPPVDTDKLRADLEAAQAANRNVSQKLRKAELLKQAAEAEESAKALTLRMLAREEAKNAAIAAAKLPVDGLTFGEDEILLNGLPFEQASFREQLVASCAIAMSSNPTIRIMHIADGNALDEEGMEVLKGIAAANDFQVWLESVKPQTDTAIIIENGKVKGK